MNAKSDGVARDSNHVIEAVKELTDMGLDRSRSLLQSRILK
jgi:hypothetical protein